MNKEPIPIIKKANIADAYSLSQLVIVCWKEAYTDILNYDSLRNLDKTITADRYKKNLAHEHNIYILWLENQMIGFISFGPARDNYLDCCKSSEIYAIYVRQSFWKMGFGKKLLDFAEQQITYQYKSKSIIIWSLENNLRSHTFYTKNNYVLTNRCKEFDLFEYKYPEVMFLKQMK